MGIKLTPLLEIDLGSKKLYFSNQAMKLKDNERFIQYEGRLKSEGGISRSFSLQDFKNSVSVASNVGIVNGEYRLQDFLNKFPEGFTAAKLSYLRGNIIEDMTSKFLEISGIISSPNFDKLNMNFSIKDSQKLFSKTVPPVVFDENTFQTSFIPQDATFWTKTRTVGDPSSDTGSKSLVLCTHIVSNSFGNRPENYWKGSRIDVVMDKIPSDHTDNCSGQFAVVVRSADSTVFFNYELDDFLTNEDQTSFSVINNTMYSQRSQYNTDNSITIQLNRNPIPQNADNIGEPIPIIYGAPQKVPMIWAIGQKSTRTNSFGVGDDTYIFACHKCKLGPIPEKSLIGDDLVLTGIDNGVYKYVPDSYDRFPQGDAKEITDGLRVEVYWSLEDKRVVDARISPNNKNWIPNPFPKRWSGGGVSAANGYRDVQARLISPLHRIKMIQSLKGDVMHVVQLRGGEFDWYDLTTRLEQRAQYPIRYGMGNSKLYVSVEGHVDTLDQFYTGYEKNFYIKEAQFGTVSATAPILENAQDTPLIINPADIMLHFIMNYTGVNLNRKEIDLESFRKSRLMLKGWRFDTALNELTSSQDIIDRFSNQCCSIVFVENGKFKMKTIIPSKIKNAPKMYLREDEHLSNCKFEFSKTEEVYNNFIFKYFYDYPTGTYNKVIKRDRITDQACRESYAKNGFEKSKEVIEFRDISDDFTANQLADVLVDIYSKRRIYLSCQVVYTDEIFDGKLEIGDCVAVTSETAPGNWIEKPCIILDTQYMYDRMNLKLVEI